MKTIFIAILLFFSTYVLGQTQFNTGITLKLIPEIHLGLYSNIEVQPFNNAISCIVGIDGYYKLTNGNTFKNYKIQYKRHYNVVAQTYLGIGYLKKDIEGYDDNWGIYPTFTYHMHSFKESLKNDYINQTIQQTHFGWHIGLLNTFTFSDRFNFQFYCPLPFFYRHTNFNWRYVNMKFGVNLAKLKKSKKKKAASDL